jgi:hypothetical protein
LIKATSELIAEKAELALRLNSLEGVQERNRQVIAECERANRDIAELRAKVRTCRL